MKSLPFSTQKSARGGFTFLEIIIVVAIIGILASLVGPRLIGRTKKAKIQATRAQMSSIKTALTAYDMSSGMLPSTSEGLKALVQRPSGADEDDWEQELEVLPKDSWREPFAYKYPSEHGMDFDLSSKGPDRQEGTEDDINNWDVLEEG